MKLENYRQIFVYNEIEIILSKLKIVNFLTSKITVYILFLELNICLILQMSLILR